MSKDKKQILYFLTKMITFIVIFIAVFTCINNIFLTKSDNLYNYINYSNQTENSIDILIMGSSHSMDGISARKLDSILSESYGVETHSFNMSITGMRLEQIHYRLMEALKTQTPKLLIIETFSCVPQSTGTNESINRWSLDYVPLSINKLQYIEDEIEEELKTSFVLPFIKYHSRWKELTSEDFEIMSREKTKRKSFHQGVEAPNKPDFVGTEDDYFAQDFTLITQQRELPEDYKIYMRKILEVCKSIDCKVLFLSIPYKVQADFYATELIKYNNFLQKEYVDETEVYMYDMNKAIPELKWGYQYMTDEGHVNNSGREVINQELAKRINGIWSK